MKSLGKLYLIPVPVTEEGGLEQIAPYNLSVCRELKHFIAENPKTARKHLKLFSYPSIEQAQISELNLHTEKSEIINLLKPLLEGKDCGLMSEAGAPGIADPGADLIALAHKNGIPVVPLSGPSAIMSAIMSSGLNGQNFAFTGYLPREKNELKKKLKEMELMAERHKQAQFFIETPYRNIALFEMLLGTLKPDTLLYLGINLHSDRDSCHTKSVKEWKASKTPEMNKVPVVFGIY